MGSTELTALLITARIRRVRLPHRGASRLTKRASWFHNRCRVNVRVRCRRRPHFVRHWLSTVLPLLSCWLLSCASAPPPVARSSPAYDPEEAVVFNDLFRPELFGMHLSSEGPEQDPLLGERTAFADSVFVARVVTINEEVERGNKRLSVVVRASEPQLAGAPVPEAITLRVAGNTPAFLYLQGAARRWVGSSLVIFLRRYRDGPHFHGTVDSPAVRRAIAAARARNQPRAVPPVPR